MYWYNKFLACKPYQLDEVAIPFIICYCAYMVPWCGDPYLLRILSFGLEDLSQKTDLSTRMIFMRTVRMIKMMTMVWPTSLRKSWTGLLECSRLDPDRSFYCTRQA